MELRADVVPKVRPRSAARMTRVGRPLPACGVWAIRASF
jgi:hypothetical protein